VVGLSLDFEMQRQVRRQKAIAWVVVESGRPCATFSGCRGVRSQRDKTRMIHTQLDKKNHSSVPQHDDDGDEKGKHLSSYLNQTCLLP
jgi:hypothetical protein